MLDSSHCQDRFTSDEIIKYLFRLHKTNFCIFSSAFIVKSWLYRWALIVVNNSFLRGFLCWIPHTVRISLLPHDPEAPADLCVCVCESPGQCQSHCLPRCFTNPISSPSSFYLQHSLCLLSVCVCVRVLCNRKCSHAGWLCDFEWLMSEIHREGEIQRNTFSNTAMPGWSIW